MENKIIIKDSLIVNEKDSYEQAKEKIRRCMVMMNIAPKATKEQKEMFIDYAISVKLNPLKREIYFLPFGGTYQPYTAYQVYLSRAFKSGKLDYIEAEIGKSSRGEAICTVAIKRHDSSKEMKNIYYFKEHVPSNKNPMWEKMPIFMFKKTAMKLAIQTVLSDVAEIHALPLTVEEMNINPDRVSELEQELSTLNIKKQNVETIDNKKEKEIGELVNQLNNIQNEKNNDDDGLGYLKDVFINE